MIKKEALLVPYAQVLREAAKVHESEQPMSEELATRLLCVAMEMNMTQAFRAKNKLGDYYPDLKARIDFLLPLMREIGENFEDEYARQVAMKRAKGE